jgi:catechol 2,3-dioxygenase-like lactoylglutathione lyase family enzyme
MPPMHEIAHLAHVELRTPVLAESLEFFTQAWGLKTIESFHTHGTPPAAGP